MKLFTSCTPTCTTYRDTLASEVKCLRVIERRDLSNERNTFKSKTIFYHKKTRLKPERATRSIPKRRPLYATATTEADPEKKASVRDSYKADPEKKKASVRNSYKADPKRRRPLYATATKPIRKEEGLCTRQLQGRSRKEGLRTRQLQGRSRKEEGLCTRQLQG